MSCGYPVTNSYATTPCSLPSNCSIPNYNHLVVPTGGSWADPRFLETINRTIITKSIVALDCADTSCYSAGLANLIYSTLLNPEGTITQLSEALDQLVGCIVTNNAVTSTVACQPAILATIIATDTQTTIASSTPPPDFRSDAQTASVLTTEGHHRALVAFSSALANPSSWFEYIGLSPYNPGYINYNWVSHAGEFARLFITIQLTFNPLYQVAGALPEAVDDCPDDPCDDGPVGTIENNWCPA